MLRQHGEYDDKLRAQLRRLALMPLLDGARPSGTLGWVSPVAPGVTQAAVGAGHWAAGRWQRALAEWAGAAGFGLVAWGLGTEAPALAEVESIRRHTGNKYLRVDGGRIFSRPALRF